MAEALAITAEQRRAIEKHPASFQVLAKTDEFNRDQRERLEHVRYFREVLPAKLPNLSGADVQDLVGRL